MGTCERASRLPRLDFERTMSETAESERMLVY